MKMLLLSLLLVGTQAFALENSTRGQLNYETADTKPVGFAPFIGLGAGYTQYNKNSDVEGQPTNLKLIGSYITQATNYVFDLGLGTTTYKFSQQAATASRMNGVLAEAGARYQWANRWQAGVIAQTMFNKGDLFGADQADAQFAGFQVLKEMNFSKNMIMRLGGRLMTDINITHESVQMAMIDLHIGLGQGAKHPSSVTTQSASNNAATNNIAMAPAKIELQKMASAELKNQNIFYFGVSSSSLTAAQTEKISALAKALASNPGLVSQVEIVGHTDQTGAQLKNKNLSLKRATAIAQIMKNAGLKSANIRSTAAGSTELATSEKAELQKNRRAEIKFHDVKDAEQLKQILNSLM